ncbi:MAG TPA: anti-sigma factor [Devosiaceae bacterium]
MNDKPAPLTDFDLLAYADGQLDAARHSEVERLLAENPVQAETVGEWRQQDEALAALFGPASEEVVPGRLQPRNIVRAGAAARNRVLQFAAAATVLVGVGIGAGWMARGLTEPSGRSGVTLVSEAVTAHSIYSVEVVHPVEVRADQEAHLATWLSRRLDRPLTIPDLRAKDFDLVGGRLLPAETGPAAQFMYEDKAGHRVTLYVVPRSGNSETALLYSQLDRLEAFYWTDKGISCAIVGDLPRDRLKALAVASYDQLG